MNRKLEVLRQPYGEPGTLIQEADIPNQEMVDYLISAKAYRVVEETSMPDSAPVQGEQPSLRTSLQVDNQGIAEGIAQAEAEVREFASKQYQGPAVQQKTPTQATPDVEEQQAELASTEDPPEQLQAEVTSSSQTAPTQRLPEEEQPVADLDTPEAQPETQAE